MRAGAASAARAMAFILSLSAMAPPEPAAQSSVRDRVAQRGGTGLSLGLALDAGLSAPSGSLALYSNAGLELGFGGVASLALGLPLAFILSPGGGVAAAAIMPGDVEASASLRGRIGALHGRAALSLGLPTGSRPGSGRGDPPQGSPNWRTALDVELGLVRDPAALGLGLGLALRIPRPSVPYPPGIELRLALSCALALNEALSISYGADFGLSRPIVLGAAAPVFSGGALLSLRLARRNLAFSLGLARGLEGEGAELRLALSCAWGDRR